MRLNFLEKVELLLMWIGAFAGAFIGWAAAPDNTDGIFFGAFMFCGVLMIFWDK